MNDEYQENLHEAKATILLQEKQLASYEKLIKKQNDKIQLLRSFIWKLHGKQQLDEVEASTPTTSSSTFTNSHSTSPRRTMPTSIKNKATSTTTSIRSNHSKNTDDAMMHIRLGEKDLHSFFFDTTEPSSQARHWQTISSLSPTNDTNSAPPPAAAESSPPRPLQPLLSAVLDDDIDTNALPQPAHAASTSAQSQQPITEILSQSSQSSQSSHTTDDDASFTIEGTPQRHSVIISPISITPFQNQQQQQPRKGTLLETLTDIPKSPSDRYTRNQRQKQKQQQHSSAFATHKKDRSSTTTTTTFGQYLDDMYQPSSSSASTKRTSLTSIDINQRQVNRNDDQFLKRPASNSEFPYAEVVRKKDERAKLHGVTCACCAKYFESSTSATPNTIQERIQKYSRHRERFKQPSTPPGFWDLDFPDSPLN